MDAYQDDEFNIFLFTLAALFVCALLGAAFIGALMAALIIAFLFLLISIGFLSTATAIGIYKRSFRAGFSSLMMLIFGTGFGLIGSIGILLFVRLFSLPITQPTALIIGLTSGALAGVVLGTLSVKIIQRMLQFVLQKVKAIPQ
jgi:hypothetical protein